MGHCTPSKQSSLFPSPAPVVPLSKPDFSASVFTLQPVGSGCLLSVGCDPTSQDATVHLLNLQLPVFSYFVFFSICKWHFSGTEGGSGPQVCFLSPLALPGSNQNQMPVVCLLCWALERGQKERCFSPSPAVLTISPA